MRVLTLNTTSKGVEASENDKQLVCCCLWEYIFPTMFDNAILEKIIVPFFIKLDAFKDQNYLDLALKSLLNFASDDELKKFAGKFFKLNIENIVGYTYFKDDDFQERMRLLSVIIRMVKFPKLLAAWFSSANICADLESLYYIHAPSKTDLLTAFPLIYYPNNIFPETNKAMFYKNMTPHCHRCNLSEEPLIELTKIFMSDTSIKFIDGNNVIPRIVMINFMDHLIKKNIKYIQEYVFIFYIIINRMTTKLI